MIYKSGNSPDEKAEACKVMGHKPGEAARPATFAELSTMEPSIVCLRCKKKL